MMLFCFWLILMFIVMCTGWLGPKFGIIDSICCWYFVDWFDYGMLCWLKFCSIWALNFWVWYWLPTSCRC